MELLYSEQGVSSLSRATACAGFDVGELTALVFAGALNFEDALRVVKVRRNRVYSMYFYYFALNRAWDTPNGI